jgi:hypothetical protein
MAAAHTGIHYPPGDYSGATESQPVSPGGFHASIHGMLHYYDTLCPPALDTLQELDTHNTSQIVFISGRPNTGDLVSRCRLFQYIKFYGHLQ